MKNKKLIFLIGIGIVLIFGFPLFAFIKSKIQCGKDGMLVGSLNEGYNCSYRVVDPEYKNLSQCPDSKQFCELKGKEDKNGSCLSGGVDLTNRIKVDENGGFYIEEGPVFCSYCCGTANNKIQTNNFKYDSNKLSASPIVDLVNMINTRGEKVDKFVKGTFKVIDTGEVFEYQERYNPNQGDMMNYNSNAVNDCIDANCSFVYFKKESNNEQEKVSLYNSNDGYQIGFISRTSFLRILKDDASGKTTDWSEKEVLPHKIGDRVSYEVNDLIRRDVGVHGFTEELCFSFKGGDTSCKSPSFKKGDEVYFPYGGGSGEGLRGGFSVYKTTDIIKTQLISYQYYMKPDTGEVFPVVQR